MGDGRRTSSTSHSAKRAERFAWHDGHRPRRRQENARRCSAPQLSGSGSSRSPRGDGRSRGRRSRSFARPLEAGRTGARSGRGGRVRSSRSPARAPDTRPPLRVAGPVDPGGRGRGRGCSHTGRPRGRRGRSPLPRCPGSRVLEVDPRGYPSAREGRAHRPGPQRPSGGGPGRTTFTRLGMRSWRRFSCTSIPLKASLTRFLSRMKPLKVMIAQSRTIPPTMIPTHAPVDSASVMTRRCHAAAL